MRYYIINEEELSIWRDTNIKSYYIGMGINEFDESLKDSDEFGFDIEVAHELYLGISNNVIVNNYKIINEEELMCIKLMSTIIV